MLRIIPTLAAILMFSTAFAEEPTELITDRPDQTESAETISPGSVQTELGIGDASSSDSSFTGLVRIGLHNKIELRVGLDEWFLSGSDDALDFSLGAKFRFLEEEGRRPAMSAIVAVNSTTNDDSDKTLPSFRMIFAQTINDRLSLGYNAGVSWVDENGDLSSRFLWTVALGIEGTETVGFFVEAFGDTGKEIPHLGRLKECWGSPTPVDLDHPAAVDHLVEIHLRTQLIQVRRCTLMVARRDDVAPAIEAELLAERDVHVKRKRPF